MSIGTWNGTGRKWGIRRFRKTMAQSKFPIAPEEPWRPSGTRVLKRTWFINESHKFTPDEIQRIQGYSRLPNRPRLWWNVPRRSLPVSLVHGTLMAQCWRKTSNLRGAEFHQGGVPIEQENVQRMESYILRLKPMFVWMMFRHHLSSRTYTSPSHQWKMTNSKCFSTASLWAWTTCNRDRK